MSETTPLIKAALNLRVGAGFDVYGLSVLLLWYSTGTIQAPDNLTANTLLRKDSQQHYE